MSSRAATASIKVIAVSDLPVFVSDVFDNRRFVGMGITLHAGNAGCNGQK
jgi:hypothetical protein